MRKVRRNLFWSLEKVPTNLPLLLAVNCQIQKCRLAFPTQYNDTIGIAILQPEQIVACCSTGGPSIRLSGRSGHVPIPGAASWAIAGKDTSVCALSSGNPGCARPFLKSFLLLPTRKFSRTFLQKKLRDMNLE